MRNARSRPLWSAGATALAILVLATGAADAAALTRAQAERIALSHLKPQKARGQVVVFGLPRALGAGRHVFDGGPTSPTGKATRRTRPLGRRAWLFWEDLAYGEKFEHPSRIVLIDDRDGRVMRDARMLWHPVIDGRVPPFLTARGYGDPRYQVYSSLPRERRARGAATAAGTPAAPIAIPKDGLKGDCVIDVGRAGDERTAPDFKRLDGLADRLKAAGTGLKHYAAGAGPPQTPSEPGRPADAPDGADLKRNVSTMTKAPHDCRDILIYINGHGAKTGPARVQVGGRNWRRAGRPRSGRRQQWTGDNAVVTSDDVRDILAAHRDVTFKLKIDACYAGRFVLDLPKDEHPNLRIIEASSNAQETSSFFKRWGTRDGKDVRSPTNNPGNKLLEVDDPKNPGKKRLVADYDNGLSEFSNGNFAALETFITTPALIAAAQAQGGSLLARALEYAAAHSSEQDFAAQLGATTPLTVVNIPAAELPPPAPSCATALGASLTTPTTNPGAGLPHFQLTGSCTGQPPVRKVRVELIGKPINGFAAHSPSCAPPLPTASLTCEVKPDGRICMLLYPQPNVTAGDIVKITLLGDGDAVLQERTITLGAASEPTCNTGG